MTNVMKTYSAARLLSLLYDWPKLTHHVRHECGFIVPDADMKACQKCGSGWAIETYEDVWVWT